MATTNGKKRKRGNSFVWKNVVVAVIAVALIIVLARLVQIFALPRSGEQVSSVLPGAIIALTEEQRAQNQLGNLTTNALLTQAAQNAANDMATRNTTAKEKPFSTRSVTASEKNTPPKPMKTNPNIHAPILCTNEGFGDPFHKKKSTERPLRTVSGKEIFC